MTLERRGARLLLKIKDTGMGISKENLPLILTAFGRPIPRPSASTKVRGSDWRSSRS